ncbi:DNA adenine methylase, partial [Escherichia coli]
DICIYNQDAKSFLQNTVTGFPLKTLLYLDPPYYVKGKGLYQNHYSHDDHVEIANIIKSN